MWYSFVANGIGLRSFDHTRVRYKDHLPERTLFMSPTET